MQAVVKASAAPGFEVLEVAEPTRAPGEVLLRVEAASVCGTDVHLWDWNPWAAARVRPPRVMGHEMCGVVLEGGGAGLVAGTRVAVESHLTCGRCAECRRGDRHVCENTRILGVDVDGAFADYVAVPAANLYAMTAAAPAEHVALMEPFGNAVHACTVRPLAGCTVLVMGCGPIGCAAVAIARADGASRVVAVDVRDYRLELAERMGAHMVVRAPAGDAALRAAVGGPVDCVLEMSGAATAVTQATRLLRPGGWISLLGIGDAPALLDFSTEIVMKGLTVYGVAGRRLPQTWEQTRAYLAAGVDPSPLLTHRLALSEVRAAIELMRSGQCGKVVLVPDRLR